jgi:hypothetical protein
MLNELTDGRPLGLRLAQTESLRHAGLRANGEGISSDAACDAETGNRHSAIDGRKTSYPGYEISLSKRWLVEKPSDGLSNRSAE